ncbi:MAG: AAA family ATPase [Gammaproteobacteria bacterium]|nr:AAA family ATPase [Gammaproteobacteria bacterium]MDH5728266.1 AAA family ATPase [Gammaproteobacteria bacterium]
MTQSALAIGNATRHDVSFSQEVVDESLLYAGFFHLNALPFSLTPDPEYFFQHASAQDALNKLLFAVRSGEGFIKITGEVGVGKTLLCRTFLNMLEPYYVTAYIPNPYMEPMTLLYAIADELGIQYQHNSNQYELLKQLTHFLINTYAETKKTVVVCLDEAHAMPLITMEVLRLLSNLETPKRKLLQLVLFAQPELDRKLEHSSVRQLRQRISFSGVLATLNKAESEDYITHRLNVAGHRGSRIFHPLAMRRLYLASHGVPRILNILAHKAMISAYADSSRSVLQKHVYEAIEDTDSLRVSQTKQNKSGFYRRYFFFLIAASIATYIAAQIANGFWWL